MVEEEVRRFYEQEADQYDELRFKSYQGLYVDLIQKSAVVELVGECRGKRILEIGSGTGRFTQELVKCGAHVVCIDLSRRMHDQSRRTVCNDSAACFVMSGSKLGFADETFDGCLTINVMSHVRDDSGIFVEVNRVLKEHGFFVANFPNVSGIFFPIGVFVNAFERSLQAPVYSRWYSLGRLIDSLRNAGLHPVRILGHMIFPRKYCPGVLFKCLKELDRIVSCSSLKLLSGDLFIKSQKQDRTRLDRLIDRSVDKIDRTFRRDLQ